MLNSYPQFNDTPTLRMSESKLQRKLHDPWILGSKNPAEAGVLGRGDAPWTETVGDVKGFCPNLHTLSFVDPEFPRYRSVELERSWALNIGFAHVPERTQCGGCKR